MTNIRILLQALAAFTITVAFSGASFAGEFTVQATLSLNSVERLADDALIAEVSRIRFC